MEENITFPGIITKLYKTYADYTNKEKMLPDSTDGLLPVQRRILLTLHLIAKNEFVKTTKVLGENMARFHPHSPAEGTVAWAVQNDFADGDGQWGSNIGIDSIEPANPRYTKVKSNKFIEELAFKYIRYVDWVESEVDLEPRIIPTMFPFCLITKYGISSVGFGFKTIIPNYTIEDLISRLMFLIGENKKECIIKPNIIGCKIISGNKELKKLLNTGEETIELIGKYKIDHEKKKVHIYGWCPYVTFTELLNKMDRYKGWNLLSNKDIGWIDISNNKNGTEIIFEVSKQRNTGDIFSKVIECIEKSLQGKISYRCYTGSLNEEIKITSVDEMLLNSYNYFMNAYKRYFKETIEDLKEKLKEVELIEKIRPYISNCFKNTDEESIQKLSKDSGVSIDDIKIIVEKYKIRKLLTVKTDKNSIIEDIKNRQEKLKNIIRVTIEDYKILSRGDLIGK